MRLLPQMPFQILASLRLRPQRGTVRAEKAIFKAPVCKIIKLAQNSDAPGFLLRALRDLLPQKNGSLRWQLPGKKALISLLRGGKQCYFSLYCEHSLVSMYLWALC